MDLILVELELLLLEFNTFFVLFIDIKIIIDSTGN